MKLYGHVKDYLLTAVEEFELYIYIAKYISHFKKQA